MSFIQIIDVRTKEYEKMEALDREWEAATEGRRAARKSIVTRDRNDPDRHLIIVFFDSYESAMENSNLPETQEFSARWGELSDGPPTFVDLDVVEERMG